MNGARANRNGVGLRFVRAGSGDDAYPLNIAGFSGSREQLHSGTVPARAGFTLVEVLAAVAILGGAVFILLNTHYSALRLYEEMNDSVVRRQLLERVVGEAEFGVLTGEVTGSGEFEGRYAGYTWSYQGTPTGGTEESPIPFYQVEATLRDPEGKDETLTFYVFNISSTEVVEGNL